MGKHILAIDQGTTATTVLLLDASLNLVAKASREILPTYPNVGWVEHDLNKIWEGTLRTIDDAMGSRDRKDIAAISITNQRETVGAWHSGDGRPLAPAIVWQCRRTAPRCLELRQEPGFPETVKKITGLVLDPYFSATKIEWLLQSVPGLRETAEAGDAFFGTIDSYLLFRLTQGESFATDVSNASRTLLMDLKSLDWDKNLLEKFGLKRGFLPKILSSSSVFGKTKGSGVLPDGIPIAGILGDQQSALFGQMCWDPGESKCTYGTGAFLMCNTGPEIVYSQRGLLTTVGWQVEGKTSYALEGSAFVAGAAVQFLRDNLGIISSSQEIEGLALAADAKEMGDLVFVPSLTGLGAPYWEPAATGMIYGLTRGTQKSHLARATLEGIALQNDALFSAIQSDIAPLSLGILRVDGGASANNFLVQLQSDLAGLVIQRPKILETTALGSAMIAGLTTGFWKSFQEIRTSWKLDREFRPQMQNSEKKKLKEKWALAIRRVLLDGQS